MADKKKKLGELLKNVNVHSVTVDRLDVIEETESSASPEPVPPTQLTHARSSQSQSAPQPGSTIPTQPTASASRGAIPAGERRQSTSTQPVVSTSRGPMTSTSESGMSESEGPKKKKKKGKKKAASEDTSHQDVKPESHKSPDPSDIITGDTEDSRTSKRKRNEGKSAKETATKVPADKPETKKQEQAGQSLETPSAAKPRSITSTPRRPTTSSSEAYMSELEGTKKKKRKKGKKTSLQHVESESRQSSDLPPHETSNLPPQQSSKTHKRGKRKQKQIRPEPEAHSSSDPRYQSEPEAQPPLSPNAQFRATQELKKTRREEREKRKARRSHDESEDDKYITSGKAQEKKWKDESERRSQKLKLDVGQRSVASTSAASVEQEPAVNPAFRTMPDVPGLSEGEMTKARVEILADASRIVVERDQDEKLKKKAKPEPGSSKNEDPSKKSRLPEKIPSPQLPQSEEEEEDLRNAWIRAVEAGLEDCEISDSSLGSHVLPLSEGVGVFEALCTDEYTRQRYLRRDDPTCRGRVPEREPGEGESSDAEELPEDP